MTETKEAEQPFLHTRNYRTVCGFCVEMVCALSYRKRNKDEQIFSQVIEKKREIKQSKEEELREQKKREKESSRAYDRWLSRKVLYTSACVQSSLFHRLVVLFVALIFMAPSDFVLGAAICELHQNGAAVCLILAHLPHYMKK